MDTLVPVILKNRALGCQCHLLFFLSPRVNHYSKTWVIVLLFLFTVLSQMFLILIQCYFYVFLNFFVNKSLLHMWMFYTCLFHSVSYSWPVSLLIHVTVMEIWTISSFGITTGAPMNTSVPAFCDLFLDWLISSVTVMSTVQNLRDLLVFPGPPPPIINFNIKN